MVTLDAARVAIASGDATGALAILLDVWRETRDPALADLIDRVSAFVEHPLDVVFPSSRRHLYMRWQRRIEARDNRDLPALLRTWPIHGMRSFERLATWPDDPRIAMCAAAALPIRYRADESVALLARLADPRTREKLRAAGPPWSEIVIRDHTAVDPAQLDAIDAELARAIEAETAHRTERRARFDRIFDQPADLAERAVLADWLLEHDDPRGEFITLQLAPPTREGLRRIKALLRANRRDFLGDIRTAIFGGRFQFVNGFLDRCEIDVRYLDRVEQAREWATLRDVSLEHDGERGSFAPLLPKLVMLEELRGMGDDTLDAVIGGAVPTIRRFTMPLGRVRRRDVARELDQLPKLRSLTLLEATPTAWFIGGAAWGRLEEVGISSDVTRAGEWFALFRDAQLKQLGLWDHGDWSFQFRRPAHLRISGTPRAWRVDPRDQRAIILQALRSLPARSFDTVRVRATLDAELEQEISRLRRPR